MSIFTDYTNPTQAHIVDSSEVKIEITTDSLGNIFFKSNYEELCETLINDGLSAEFELRFDVYSGSQALSFKFGKLGSPQEPNTSLSALNSARKREWRIRVINPLNKVPFAAYNSTFIREKLAFLGDENPQSLVIWELTRDLEIPWFLELSEHNKPKILVNNKIWDKLMIDIKDNNFYVTQLILYQIFLDSFSYLIEYPSDDEASWQHLYYKFIESKMDLDEFKDLKTKSHDERRDSLRELIEEIGKKYESITKVSDYLNGEVE